MKKTAHIIYPFDLKKKINPWSIGNNLYYALSKNYKIKTYTWTSLKKIYPNKNDLLIGHCHSNPYTIFRRSVSNNNWYKKILVQPFNGDVKQMSHLYDIMPMCDDFIAICGTYWMKNLEKSLFKIWKKKITQIDLGLDINQYPFVKEKFNNIGERKFLYIGNDYSYNNYAKNLNYLEDIVNKVGSKRFATIGNKHIHNVKHYGWIDFKEKKNHNLIKKYDFLIHTSNFDANPSTVLEGISWGIMPIMTKQCGYEGFDKIMYIPLNNVSKAVKKINFLQNLNQKKLKNLQKINLQFLKNKYNWKNFRLKILKVVNKKKTNFIIKYNKKQIKQFENYRKLSPNYYLRYDNIISIIKSNIKIFIKRID